MTGSFRMYPRHGCSEYSVTHDLLILGTGRSIRLDLKKQVNKGIIEGADKVAVVCHRLHARFELLPIKLYARRP